MSNQHNNPYSRAAGAYGSSASLSTDQRSLEASVLLKCAAKLQSLTERLQADAKDVPLEMVEDALTANRKLWAVFLHDAMEDSHDIPLDLKNNIANLALFVSKRTTQMLIEPTPQGIEVLITINRQIASGLMKSAQNAAATSAQATAPAQRNVSDI